MLLNLLNFFEGEAGTEGTGGSNIVVWIIFAVMIALMVVMMIVPNRKAKKQQEEMQSKLAVGVTIMTIGGIVGTIVEMDNEYIWIATGLGENKQVMQLTSRAIHSIVTAPAVPTATDETQDEVVDEIK